MIRHDGEPVTGQARRWDREVDVVVAGSGAAGLCAALTAAAGGARVLVLEKARVLGGTTAMSGAGTWVPANHHMLAAGLADSKDEALTYLRAVAPDGWAEVEEPLWRAFVEHAPEMLAFVEAHSPLEFELVHHPDPYVEAPGGKAHGRMLSPRLISQNILGPWRDRIRRFTRGQRFKYSEMVVGPVLSRPVPTLLKLAPALAYRWLTRRVGMGNALVTGLLKGCLDHGVEVMAETRVTQLVTEGRGAPSRVTGVEAVAGGRPLAIRAARGVVLATGGFEWDPELRARYFPGDVGLIGGPRTNTGDGQRMAAAVGARLERMDQALIYCCLPIRYEGYRHAVPITDVYSPHCIVVDRDGRRFMNEGRPNLGVAIDERDPATGLPVHLPAWRIFDAQFARRNPSAMLLWRLDPERRLRRASNLAQLAGRIGLDPAALAATVERFNEFARRGRDEDFHRGETAWEKFSTPDPGPETGGNGALGTIRVPPFYAAPYDRAILVTKGGPRANARGQVLREDGSVIEGLYCAGVAMANPIGSKAVGAGSTIGPCMTWGYICGRDLTRDQTLKEGAAVTTV